jgi:hypothetical protein
MQMKRGHPGCNALCCVEAGEPIHLLRYPCLTSLTDLNRSPNAPLVSPLIAAPVSLTKKSLERDFVGASLLRWFQP